MVSRYELKYFISEAKADYVRERIKSIVPPDRFCKDHGNRAYMISSLYLDSYDLRLCNESLHGEKNRFKLRIRRYCDNPERPSFLEIKRRMNTIIMKSRAAVNDRDIKALYSDTLPVSTENGNLDALRQFQFYMGSIDAKPVTLVRYNREAYETIEGGKVRLTFDRDLSYKLSDKFQVTVNGTGWQRHPMKSVIFEVKFTEYFPPWLNELILSLDIRPKSIPKYVQSVTHACETRHLYRERLNVGEH